MIKKVLIIIATIHVISIIQSCCTKEFQYKWTDFNIETINNSGEYPVLTHHREVNKNALGFRITLLDSVMYLARNYSLTKECYATSCAEEYTRAHNLISVKIKTLFAYSPGYPEESDITLLFKARESENTESNYISIDAIISEVNAGTHKYGRNAFDLYLTDTTALTGEQAFELELTMSDGTILTQKTDTLTLF